MCLAGTQPCQLFQRDLPISVDRSLARFIHSCIWKTKIQVKKFNKCTFNLNTKYEFSSDCSRFTASIYWWKQSNLLRCVHKCKREKCITKYSNSFEIFHECVSYSEYCKPTEQQMCFVGCMCMILVHDSLLLKLKCFHCRNQREWRLTKLLMIFELFERFYSQFGRTSFKQCETWIPLFI